MQKRVLSVLTCLILLASLSIEAFAAPMTLFNTTITGYSCTGTGFLSTSSATATLTATLIPDLPHIPSDECSTQVTLVAYNTEGSFVGGATGRGTTFATATYTNESSTFSKMLCDFMFNGTYFGPYTLLKN